MAELNKDHPSRQQGEDPNWLEYAHPRTSDNVRRGVIAGYISALAMVIQVPWLIGFAYWSLYAGIAPPSTSPPISKTLFFACMAVWPWILGLTCGWYSVRVAKISWRNGPGVLGLFLAIAGGIGFLVLVVTGGHITL